MSALRVLLVAMSLLGCASFAAAQSEDPEVNESDFDTSTPPPDDAYLEESATASEGAEADPTLDEDDFDTSTPTPDDSYLAEDASTTGAPQPTTSLPTPPAAKSDVPGLGAVFVAALAGVALALRRRA